MVAVLRIGLGRAGIARVQALERSQRCAHQIGDRAVLLGDRLFQTDGIDAHAHLIDPFARAEAQCRDDEPDAEIVRGAHGGPEGPAVVNATAVVPCSRLLRNSMSKRYGSLSWRSSRDTA